MVQIRGILTGFKDMRARILEAQDNLTVTEFLHRATIAQEVRINDTKECASLKTQRLSSSLLLRRYDSNHHPF